MALRRIISYRDEILRKKSREVDNFDQRLHDLLSDMADTLYDAQGVGLAAVQLGTLRRVVVIDDGNGKLELVNPEIIETEGSVINNEGCLSFPGKFGDVERPRKVTVRAKNRYGKEITVTGEDLLARALCHEIDHLEGKLFIDKATNITSGHERNKNT